MIGSPGAASAGRIDLDYETRFDHPCGRVFELLSDPRLRPRWQRSVRAVELLDGGEPRRGMRWRESPHGLVTFALEIVAYEPQRVWAERFSSRFAAGTIELRFSADGPGATRLQLRATVQLHGAVRLARPIVRQLLRREMIRDLGQVGRVLASDSE